MNKDTRIHKIQEIIERDKSNPFGKQEIPWKDKLETMDVYQIPLEYLVYNKYNGRILSRTKSLERQNQIIDVETDEGKKHIERLLWDSNDTRNKKTKKSIELYGQQKVGIITKDGIIIDGNRRAMILAMTGKQDYFKAIVLDVTLDENPLEIEKLETSYQMGEDEKVGYNPTEKYIKSKELYKRLTQKTYSSDPKKHKVDMKAVGKIASWMGQDDSEIIRYLNTMEIMDEYLDYLEYNGIYTQLDKREDQFLNLTKWLKLYYGEGSKKGFDGYRDTDVDDLKSVAFDYIRAKYEGKEFRLLAEGQQANHFFGDKDIWKSFYEYHVEKMDDLEDEGEVDYSSNNLNKHLDDRDSTFLENTKLDGETSFLKENIQIHEERLGYAKAKEQPQKLFKKSLEALKAVKVGHKSVNSPEAKDLIRELSDKVLDILQRTSPSEILSQVIDLLEKIDATNIPESEKDEVFEKTKKIQQLGYLINKNL